MTMQLILGAIIGRRYLSKMGTVTVAGKPSSDMPPGTLNAILKHAGLK
jgi:predicted RNA binding protein YcfA (HicA-like mRNA interferase family)